MKKTVIMLLAMLAIMVSPFCASKNTGDAFAESAAGMVLVNAETGTVLYEHNSEKRLSMASTTKIMTALLLCENADLDKEITVTEEMVKVEGSSMGLLPGDRVTFKALLYGMMLPSGNDAATATAISLGGSLKDFALMMNRRAAEIGMNGTNFVTPSGLDDERHYTTAADMAKLAVCAMKNKIFKSVVSKDTVRVEYGNPPYKRMLKGHNRLLKSYSGANGIKTGYTKKSGRCLVSSAERGAKKLIAVSLNDSNTSATHSRLLDMGFSMLDEVTIGIPDSTRTVPVISGEAPTAGLKVTPKTVGLSAKEREETDYEIAVKPFVYAPIKKGENLGRVDYFLNGKKLWSLNITASSDVERQKINAPDFLQELINNFKILLQ